MPRLNPVFNLLYIKGYKFNKRKLLKVQWGYNFLHLQQQQHFKLTGRRRRRRAMTIQVLRAQIVTTRVTMNVQRRLFKRRQLKRLRRIT